MHWVDLHERRCPLFTIEDRFRPLNLNHVESGTGDAMLPMIGPGLLWFRTLRVNSEIVRL
jgi:hypothetical protein